MEVTMFKLIVSYWPLLVLFFNCHCLAATSYYKCVTEKGTTFSQFPCDKLSVSYTIKAGNILQTNPNINYTKELNNIERERILKNLKAELKSNHYKLVILDRERDRAHYQQAQRLNHILSDSEKKKIASDITKQLKEINKKYHTDARKINKIIKKLEKKIARYQKT